MPTYFEFFAGGGMARAGLGAGWDCLFANEIDPKKASIYRRNWGRKELSVKDVRLVSASDLPRVADLVWASFPCQDLSLAGMGAGLKGERSGTFWPFWNLMQALNRDGRAPLTIVLENVCGALTSHRGADFRSIIEAVKNEGYRCGALVIDAALFLPQSRPRLFIIGVREGIQIDNSLVEDGPRAPLHSATLRAAHSSLPEASRAAWIWWRLTPPACRRQRLADLLEEPHRQLGWHSETETKHLLSLMSCVHASKVEAAKGMNRLMIGSLYKRTRIGPSGERQQRAEIRFDDLAGCLRTPGGGSSRQTIVVVEGTSVRSRLLSPRETARLMGLPDQYVLPEKCNEAYHLTGDGVVVPVVRYLAQEIIEPVNRNKRVTIEPAA